MTKDLHSYFALRYNIEARSHQCSRSGGGGGTRASAAGAVPVWPPSRPVTTLSISLQCVPVPGEVRSSLHSGNVLLPLGTHFVFSFGKTHELKHTTQHYNFACCFYVVVQIGLSH